MCWCLDRATQPADVLCRETPWSDLCQHHKVLGLLIWVSRETALHRQPALPEKLRVCSELYLCSWAFVKPPRGHAALIVPSRERQRNLERRRGSLSQKTCLSPLPCLLETEGILEHSSRWEHMESWDVRDKLEGKLFSTPILQMNKLRTKTKGSTANNEQN